MSQIQNQPLMQHQPLIQDQSWGNAKVKFLPRQFSPQDIQDATKAVKPDFEAPEDTFVMVDTEGHHTIAQIPTGEKPAIFGAKGTDKNALIDALSHARDFLKKLYPPKNPSQSHLIPPPAQKDHDAGHEPLLQKLAHLIGH